MIKLIIIGCGVVGRAFLSILHAQKEEFHQNYGVEFQVVAVCEYTGTLLNEKGLSLDTILAHNDLSKLPDWVENQDALSTIQEVEADFVIEMSWTNPDTGEPTYSFIQAAFKAGKHVVTSNKGPLYLYFEEIKQLAKEHNVKLGFESTVLSAIPCITTKDSLKGNKIKRITAILNGTSNYILSRMTSENMTFDQALNEAQKLGYAEADPKLDVEGYDAAGKLVILANELLGWQKTIADVEINGIQEVTTQMITLAQQNNFLIKHVGIAENNQLWVGLKLIPVGSTLAINGTLNCVNLETELAGEIQLTGRGAGGSEAAAGVLSDVLRIIDHDPNSK